MNYPNNDFNQNIFGAQGKKNQKNEIPISYWNGRNISPIKFGNNINDNIPSRTVQGFYPNMNNPLNQGQNIIYEKKYSRESKPISKIQML